MVARSPTGLRVDARRNREAILRAAGHLFARDGWQVAMHDVASSAGVGIGTVYRHFPSKQALLGALVAERFDLATAEVTRLASSDDELPFARLDRALRVSARLVSTHPLTRLATRGDGVPAWAHTHEARRAFDEACRPLFSAAVEDGSLRPDVVVEDVGMLMRAVCATAEEPPSDRWELLLDIIIQGLRPPRRD